MNIAIGCDHSAVTHKNEIIGYINLITNEHLSQLIISNPYHIIDVGTYSYERTDYPTYGFKVGNLVAAGEVNLGIVICGTGVGIVNAASKIEGVRATLALHPQTARVARTIYDCNMIAIGARTTGIGVALKIVDAFLKPYSNNHKR